MAPAVTPCALVGAQGMNRTAGLKKSSLTPGLEKAAFRGIPKGDYADKEDGRGPPPVHASGRQAGTLPGEMKWKCRAAKSRHLCTASATCFCASHKCSRMLWTQVLRIQSDCTSPPITQVTPGDMGVAAPPPLTDGAGWGGCVKAICLVSQPRPQHFPPWLGNLLPTSLRTEEAESSGQVLALEPAAGRV